jgi:Ca2+-binding RTX toxin-like protein
MMRLEEPLTYPRLMALYAASALIALLCVAAPAQAANPKCFGQEPTIVGTPGNDNLRGTAHADVIVGLAGNDRIDGLRGDDMICGGHDFVPGDVLRGGAGSDRLSGGRGYERFYGGAGDDVIHVRCADCFDPDGDVWQIVYGGDGDDRIYGSKERDEIHGGDGRDRIVGRGSLYEGLEGPDLLFGDGGDDRIITGPPDRHFHSSTDAFVNGGAGDDRMRVLYEAATLVGGPGNDRYINAGRCCSTASFSRSEAPVVVDLVNGTATGEGNDVLENFDTVVGSSHDDTIVGNDLSNWLQGGAGNDTITAGRDDDRIDGGAGTDTIGGGDGDDMVSGDAGNDALSGDAGVDEVSYSSAQTSVTVDLGAGSASGGNGDDTLTGFEDVTGSGEGGDHLIGDGGPNRIRSSSFDAATPDLVEGRGGDDALDLTYSGPGSRAEGGVGNDTVTGPGLLNGVILNGGDGDDLVINGAGNDTLDGGAGIDTVDFARDYACAGSSCGPSATAVEVDLAAGFARSRTSDEQDSVAGFENVNGTLSRDLISGDAGANVISGAGDADQLFGADGDDTLDGGDDGRREGDLTNGGNGFDVCTRAEEKIDCEA